MRKLLLSALMVGSLFAETFQLTKYDDTLYMAKEETTGVIIAYFDFRNEEVNGVKDVSKVIKYISCRTFKEFPVYKSLMAISATKSGKFISVIKKGECR